MENLIRAVVLTLGKGQLDYDYHVSQNCERTKNKKKTIRDIIGEDSLIRGSISSNSISAQDHPVFHLGAFNELTPSSTFNELRVAKEFLITKFQAKLLDKKVKLAQKGDILIARIGRNLHKKVAWVPAGHCIISDCIYIIRPESKDFNKILQSLTTAHNQNRKNSLARGVGAKYLTRADVFSLKV